MAETFRFRNQNIEKSQCPIQDENFCLFNVLCVFISLVTVLADLTTDILVFVEYCTDSYWYWALATLIFIISPNILMNLFSIRWYIIDQNCKLRFWITHGCLIGLLERYVIFLRKVFVCKNFESVKTQKLICQRNDLSLLHFLYIFTGTIPQIILQTYAIITFDENYHTKAFALAASIASVTWGGATYIYSITSISKECFELKSVTTKLFWHFGMLVSRVSGIILFSIVFGIWMLVPLGLHWAAMTFWIIIQKTTFCPNKLEETLYNVVMGFVYCFCFINLREGHTRYRLMMFYVLMITQNFGSLFLYILISETKQQLKPWSILLALCIVGGTIIGLCAMVLHYRYFHSKGPIPWNSSNNEDVELNNKVPENKEKKEEQNKTLTYVRSFKSSQKTKDAETVQSKEFSVEQTNQNEADNIDKNFLLDHWIATSGTPTFANIPVNNSMDASSIEMYTVENTPQSAVLSSHSFTGSIKPSIKMKKKTICSPTELNLKLSSLENLESSIDELTTNAINIQKRRGICSSDELRNGLTKLNLENCNIISETLLKTLKNDHCSEISHDTDGSNKKTSSDSIDMDLDLSLSDINSSDINTFNENIVQKLCLSALKNIKVGNQDADIENIQRIALDILKEMYAKKGKSKNSLKSETFPQKQRDVDTPTEVLSVHDYENICAVNIAREAWGLRSWNGYSDIENWQHDGSVVRDRRRDTLTSGSSEISSCFSQELKNAILAAPPFPRKAPTYSNVFVKFDRTNHEDYNIDTVICDSNDDTFLAKPCFIDTNKDPNHLEPIMEELDDLGDIDSANKIRLNSESSLVATIDEIRKATVTNSPRNIYHRREQSWNSPQFNSPDVMNSTLKKALWKEPSKLISSNIMESLPEKENIMNVSLVTKGVPEKLELSNINSLPLHDPTSDLLNHRNTKRRHRSNTLQSKPQIKKNNAKSEHLQDLSNKDIDFLWQLVSENPLPVNSLSTEDLSSSRITSSLQSLITKDIDDTYLAPITKSNNVNKKGCKSRPRRKFSILRERFEPRMNINSDEEMLYHSEGNLASLDTNGIKGNKTFNINKDLNTGNTLQANIDNLEPEIVINKSPLAGSKSIKDKRSLFMKQVLSPPKFNTKIRHKI